MPPLRRFRRRGGQIRSSYFAFPRAHMATAKAAAPDVFPRARIFGLSYTPYASLRPCTARLEYLDNPEPQAFLDILGNLESLLSNP